MKSIDSIASTQTGIATSGRTILGQPGLDVQVITGKNVGPGYLHEPYDASSVPGQEHHIKYAIEPGDVLVVTKGANFHVALAFDEHAGMVTANTIARIRCKDNLGPAVFAFLSSAAGQAELEKLAGGSTVRLLRTADLRAIAVPTPPSYICKKIHHLVQSHVQLIIKQQVATQARSELVSATLGNLLEVHA